MRCPPAFCFEGSVITNVALPGSAWRDMPKKPITGPKYKQGGKRVWMALSKHTCVMPSYMRRACCMVCFGHPYRPGMLLFRFLSKRAVDSLNGPQRVEKARLRRSFPPGHVSPAPAARPGKRARKPCCARLPNPPHMSLDSDFIRRAAALRASLKGFLTV